VGTSDQPQLINSPSDPTIKSPVFSPRPGWGGQLNDWFKDSGSYILLVVFLATLLVSIFSMTTHFARNSAVKNVGIQNTTSEEQTNSPMRTRVFYAETAQIGQGLTHLARQAFGEYAEEHQLEGLLPEHKIYIEDYLQKNVENRPSYGIVGVGQEVSFSKTDMERAVSKAMALKPEDITNLKKYTK
jgi:hypothetical protein